MDRVGGIAVTVGWAPLASILGMASGLAEDGSPLEQES
jgi:hypothetical protein